MFTLDEQVVDPLGIHRLHTVEDGTGGEHALGVGLYGMLSLHDLAERQGEDPPLYLLIFDREFVTTDGRHDEQALLTLREISGPRPREPDARAERPACMAAIEDEENLLRGD